MTIIYSRYFIYSIFFLSSLALYSISTKFFISLSGKHRLLSDKNGLENICKENKDLYKFYYENGEYEIKEKDFGKMNDGSEIILKMINEGFDTKYIPKYILQTKKYFFFLILMIIIILLSMYYSCVSCCCCCCKDKCCNFFNFSCCNNKLLKKKISILIPIIYLFVFIFAIAAIIIIIAGVTKFYGIICVGLQFVDSFVEGETRNIKPKWSGIFILSEILEKLGNITSNNNQQIAEKIYNNKRDYLVKCNEWDNYMNESYIKNTDNGKYKFIRINNPKMSSMDEEINKNITPFYAFKWGPYDQSDTILESIYNEEKNNVIINNVFLIFDKYLYLFLGCEEKNNNIECKNDSSISGLFKQASDSMKKIKEPMYDMKTKITEPMKDYYDQINETIFGIFGVVIIFVILYCIIVETVLSVFCCTKKCKCINYLLKWILCFIYYTSYLIVIAGFGIGILIGTLGNICQDLTKVVEYITSTNNIKSDEPKIFGKNEYLHYLDVCLNGDGNLASKLGLTNNFDIVDNITNITDDVNNLSNDTILDNSPLIKNYSNFFEKLNESYLNIEYYDVNDKSNYNITERIKEINNYVSGTYSNSKQENCKINETWSTKKEEKGYIYNETYPFPEINSENHYLIYLYDKDIYNTAKLNERYEKACNTNGHPYSTVSNASQKFGELFKDIGYNVLQKEFKEDFSEDLNKLNKIYGEKNKYLHNALTASSGIIGNIGDSFRKLITGKDNIFTLLNCKFVGKNKLILIHLLYTSLGLYLDYFGIFTILMSLFIFIGVIFILILIKNSKLDEKGGVSDIDLETLTNIIQGDEDNKTKNNTENLMNLELNNIS